MNIEMTPGSGALLTIRLADGRKLTNAEVAEISIEPFFRSPDGTSEVLRGVARVTAGDVVDSFTLVVGGGTGRVTSRRLSDKSVVPAIDRKFAKKKPPEGGANGGAG